MSDRFPVRPRFEALLPEELDGGTQLFEFTEDFIFNSPMYGVVVVPKGFTTDFASIPRPVKAYLDDDDPVILCPSCVHDFRYKTKFDRAESDEELYQNMIYCGARRTQAAVVHRMVRLFGGSHWKD